MRMNSLCKSRGETASDPKPSPIGRQIDQIHIKLDELSQITNRLEKLISPVLSASEVPTPCTTEEQKPPMGVHSCLLEEKIADLKLRLGDRIEDLVHVIDRIQL